MGSRLASPALWMALLLARPAPAAEPFSYADWNKVLATHVDARGYVDYAGLARNRGDLDRFIAAVERTSPKSNPELFPARNDRLAYFLNAYNAHVVRGVLARGPERESVWTGGLVSGYSFFVGMDILLGGERTNLRKLEDRTIRKGFQDPRVHAALNCASKGCPRLPTKAFDPRNLDTELDAAMAEFVGEARNVAVDDAAGTVTLSKIFDWFSGDFLAYEKARGNTEPSLIDYVNRYRGPRPRVSRNHEIRFFAYDKSLNSQAGVPPGGP